MPPIFSTVKKANGLTVKAYRGDGACLLAFDLDQANVKHLAGFAVQRTNPDKSSAYLKNRLNFASGYTARTAHKDRQWTDSNLAPFQKFWWIDFPPTAEPGVYTYRVSAMRFQGTGLKEDQSVEVSIELGPFIADKMEIGFTRGFLSSQAYADRFHNEPIEPARPTIDFATQAYQEKYAWLGYRARKMIFDLLDECVNDRDVTVDMLAYDLTEPDIVRKLQALGPRLRLLLDNSAEHVGAKALEPKAADLIGNAKAAVRRGKFSRFAHDKIIIKKKNGQAVKVLTGSTNFSVTGLYVNANNALLFDEPNAAALYERMFDLVFTSDAKSSEFFKSELSQKEFELTQAGFPHLFVSFAPHKQPTFSLNRILKEINQANSSVLFAVMGLTGGGSVLQRLKQIHKDKKVFSYGVTDETGEPSAKKVAGGVKVYTPTRGGGVLVPASALNKNIPEPFAKEATMRGAHRIHHKFVVVDFNDSNPVLFTGSSNLATGGEQSNGDNLIAIYDPGVATTYAIEAIRLVDHYHFRAAMKGATKAAPLQLKTDDAQWWKDYYDPTSIKYKERQIVGKS